MSCRAELSVSYLLIERGNAAQRTSDVVAELGLVTSIGGRTRSCFFVTVSAWRLLFGYRRCGN